MSLEEVSLLLFLVIDPFGNLPFVLAVLRRLPFRRYARAIVREMVFALGILILFALFGEKIMDYLNIERASLSIAGGIILFLISLKMIFSSTSEIFDEHYSDDPLLVPIAMPAIAGPAALTTVAVLTTRQGVPVGRVIEALILVCLATLCIFLVGRQISALLGPRGINAMEKLMGLLLNLVAVNMIMRGTREFLG